MVLQDQARLARPSSDVLRFSLPVVLLFSKMDAHVTNGEWMLYKEVAETWTTSAISDRRHYRQLLYP
jgi:hypothetical protein